MYKEYRDLSVTGAVAHMYQDMAARHRCRGQSIQIIKVGSALECFVGVRLDDIVSVFSHSPKVDTHGAALLLVTLRLL